jgi:two-component system chemotaxis response regulator CheY
MSVGNLSALQFLIVDDHDHARMITIELLRAFGARNFLQANDGFAAIDLLDAHDIDIIITDVLMHPMDGLALTRVIRGAGSTIPIIMITAHATLSVLAEARDTGVTEFLTKPITGLSFLRRLDAVIHQPRPFIQTRSRAERRDPL